MGDDRRTRIEVGYGLEATLTDAAVILSQDVAPHFRAGRFADGIEAGLDGIDRAIASTHRPAPAPDGNAAPTSPPISTRRGPVRASSPRSMR